jgi:hypothetical protein
LEAQAASVDAFYECVLLPGAALGPPTTHTCRCSLAAFSFIRTNLPKEEASPEALAQVCAPMTSAVRRRLRTSLGRAGAEPFAAQGLNSLAERVAGHTDLCWRSFEALAQLVFARPTALDAEAAAEQAAREATAAQAFSLREEAELDGRAEAARVRLAASLAAVAAMRAERSALEAELASGCTAARQVGALAASEKENVEAAVQLCVQLSGGFAPLLDRAEELCASGALAGGASAPSLSGARALIDAAAADADAARRQAAVSGSSMATLAELNARLHS